jgi:hypothetical protein
VIIQIISALLTSTHGAHNESFPHEPGFQNNTGSPPILLSFIEQVAQPFRPAQYIGTGVAPRHLPFNPPSAPRRAQRAAFHSIRVGIRGTSGQHICDNCFGSRAPTVARRHPGRHRRRLRSRPRPRLRAHPGLFPAENSALLNLQQSQSTGKLKHDNSLSMLGGASPCDMQIPSFASPSAPILSLRLHFVGLSCKRKFLFYWN